MHSMDYAVKRCLSICLSVTRPYSIKMVKHIIKLFHHWQPPHSSFSIPNIMAIFQRRPTNWGASGRMFQSRTVRGKKNKGDSHTMTVGCGKPESFLLAWIQDATWYLRAIGADFAGATGAITPAVKILRGATPPRSLGRSPPWFTGAMPAMMKNVYLLSNAEWI